ncbi:MAG: hypothetical protein ACTSYL_09705 [Candidatus Thorarchaeota archaeon]
MSTDSSDKPKPRVGIYGLTGCAGDQLLLIHCEDELLDIFNAFDIRSFVMASSNPIEEDMDVALVEGSVSTEEQKKHLLEIRKRTKILVAIGNCATVGGVQAMYAQDGTFKERMKKVYGDMKFITAPMEGQPLDAFVTVDYYLPGCPISAKQALPLLSRLLHGASPEPFPHPVCHECKLQENKCLLLDKKFCLGPLTQGGCGAVCPSHGLPCVGCWGPNPDANFNEHVKLLESFGMTKDEVIRRIRNFGGHKILQYIKDL